jgi:thiol-disulfide isomerase/thioredoxin
MAGAAVTPSAGAPDFTLPSLDGPNLTLQEQRGRVVMINFWATWCGPCRVEMPHLSKLYEKYRGSGFTVLAVNIDEDPHKAASLAKQLGMRFPVLLDTEKKVSRLYDLSTMPSSVLVDRDGACATHRPRRLRGNLRQVDPGVAVRMAASRNSGRRCAVLGLCRGLRGLCDARALGLHERGRLADP